MDQADTTRKEELAALTAMVREFAADNIAPIVADLDETERFPAEIYAQLGELGLLGITVPEEDGGVGGCVADYVTVMEELAYGYASVADQCGLVELVSSLLVKHGTSEQKARYLPG